MRLDEVHVSVFRQEGHQLVIGPEMEEYNLLSETYGERWNIDFSVPQMLQVQSGEKKATFAGCYKKLLKAKCYTKIKNINRFVDGFSASCSVLELLLREWQSNLLALLWAVSFRNYFLVVKILFNDSF